MRLFVRLLCLFSLAGSAFADEPVSRSLQANPVVVDCSRRYGEIIRAYFSDRFASEIALEAFLRHFRQVNPEPYGISRTLFNLGGEQAVRALEAARLRGLVLGATGKERDILLIILGNGLGTLSQNAQDAAVKILLESGNVDVIKDTLARVDRLQLHNVYIRRYWDAAILFIGTREGFTEDALKALETLNSEETFWAFYFLEGYAPLTEATRAKILKIMDGLKTESKARDLNGFVDEALAGKTDTLARYSASFYGPASAVGYENKVRRELALAYEINEGDQLTNPVARELERVLRRVRQAVTFSAADQERENAERITKHNLSFLVRLVLAIGARPDLIDERFKEDFFKFLERANRPVLIAISQNVHLGKAFAKPAGPETLDEFRERFRPAVTTNPLRGLLRSVELIP